MLKSLSLTLLALVAGASVLSGQVLTCASGADRCTVVHYHQQAWSPQSHQTVELYGINSFASMAACERARSADQASNAAAIDYLMRIAPRSRPLANRYGVCHCDMTMTRSDPHFLDDDRRQAQLRTDRELRLQLVDLLMDNEVTSDAPVVRALFESPRAFSGTAWPRSTPVPEPAKQKLLDPAHSAMHESYVTLATSGAPAPSRAELVEAHYDPTLSVATVALETPDNHFVESEMARMTSLLEQVNQQPDSSEKEKLLESSNRRILLLTNLSRLIESAGARSRLGAITALADTDEARVAVIGKLFGSDIATQWKAANVEVSSALSKDPVGLLRDTTGKYSDAQRQMALFAFLSQNASLTESQEIWISGIIDRLLGGK